MQRHCLLFPFAVLAAAIQAQTITITFEGTVSGVPTPLDSILVMNLTQGGDTTIHYPSNVLVLEGNTGVDHAAAAEMSMRALPDPFVGSTEVALDATSGPLRIALNDATGRTLTALEEVVSAGVHRFAVSCESPGLHLITASQGDAQRTIRLLAMEGDGAARVMHLGGSSMAVHRSDRSLFSWTAGDELRYIGYATSGDVVHSAAIDEVPVVSAIRTFVMEAGSVCPEWPTVIDIEGNVYRTTRIGGRCWMAENLRTGTYNDGSPITPVYDASEWMNLSTEGWCSPLNDADNDPTYGKLYNWIAVMDPRDVCPNGWHVPSDEEWKGMELALGVPANEVDLEGERGAAQFVGGKLKTTLPDLWIGPNVDATNESGFSGVPAGFRIGSDGSFQHFGAGGYWWSSTDFDAYNSWYRYLYADIPGIYRFVGAKVTGQSVRCIAD